MKKNSLLLCFSLFSICSMAQDVYYSFRSYNQNLVLETHANTSNQMLLGEYGTSMNQTASSSFNNKYIYQAQEYLPELDLYLFPRRIYSPQNFRFYQTDPRSQYFSPYLFVGADPVNYVDRDGKEGKPLIIYEENHDLPNAMELNTRDAINMVPDAHTCPMSQFINEGVGELEDWNGNVFFMGHMSEVKGLEMEIETAINPTHLKTDPKIGKYMRSKAKTDWKIFADARDMGGALRRFANQQKVPLKNVVAGGCQGSFAAQGMAEGFASSAETAAKNEVHFTGLRENLKSMYVGPHNLTDFYQNKYRYSDQTMFLVETDGKEMYPKVKVHPDGSRELRGFGERWNRADKVKVTPMAKGNDAMNLINGRVPDHLEENFSHFFAKY